MYPGSQDEGDLTAKQSLPVMKLSYGGAFTRHSSINYILGPLVCSGKSDSLLDGIQGKGQFQFFIVLKLWIYLGKSKPYPSEKEKLAQEELQSKIDQISTSIEELENTTNVEMKSKIKEISASIEELKNTPKVIIAFRATCAKNFPSSDTIYKSENPGYIIWSQSSAFSPSISI